jgi:hypothetical protein
MNCQLREFSTTVICLHKLPSQFIYQLGFEVLTAVSTKMAVFWVVAPCSLVEVYRSGRRGYEKNPLPLSGIEPRSSSP